MEKTSIKKKKEQHHTDDDMHKHVYKYTQHIHAEQKNRWTKEWMDEKSVQLSHKHVAIFISLLGVFSLSQFRQNVCSAWSLRCRCRRRPQLWSLSSVLSFSLHIPRRYWLDAGYFVRIQSNRKKMDKTISIRKCGINMWKFSILFLRSFVSLNKNQNKNTKKNSTLMNVLLRPSFFSTFFLWCCAACDNSCYCWIFFLVFLVCDYFCCYIPMLWVVFSSFFYFFLFCKFDSCCYVMRMCSFVCISLYIAYLNTDDATKFWPCCFLIRLVWPCIY